MKKKLFRKKKSFIITKEKKYDGNDSLERKFMYGLFEGRKKQVTAEILKNTFYKTINDIKINLNAKKINMIDKKSVKKTKIVSFLIVIIYLVIFGIPLYESFNQGGIVAITMIIAFGFVFVIPLTSKKRRIAHIISLIVLRIVFVAIPWVYVMKFVLFSETIYIYAYIIGYICIIIMLLFRIFMIKRTPFANEILGKIRGFKRFLRVAKKSKLEALVMENPTYFYDILPYTYVLDVSDKWIKKFEKINMKPPTWYESNTSYNLTSFKDSVDSTMETARKVMTYSPASESSSDGGSRGGSSGDSGGGSSGGGSGGGGSSW